MGPMLCLTPPVQEMRPLKKNEARRCDTSRRPLRHTTTTAVAPEHRTSNGALSSSAWRGKRESVHARGLKEERARASQNATPR